MAISSEARLVLLRDQRGWTQAEIAKRIGMSSAAVSKHERGEVELGPKLIAKYAKAYGMAYEQLHGLLFPEVQAPVGATSAGTVTRAATANLTEGIERVEVGPDGHRRYRILGDSMEPAIPAGSVISTVVYQPDRDPDPIGRIVQVYVWDDDNERGGPVLGILHQHGDSLILTKANALKHPPVVVPREHVTRIELVTSIAPPGR